MDTAKTQDAEWMQKRLKEVFDQVTREVTRQAAGIRLYEGAKEPAGQLCTVYAEFQRGFHTGISLCADASMFVRLTRHMMKREDVSPQDVEDFSKEYFNVLCGHIATGIFRATKVAPRFSTPAFFHGCYTPDGHATHFILNYTSDEQENVQLTHHMPTGVVQ